MQIIDIDKNLGIKKKRYNYPKTHNLPIYDDIRNLPIMRLKSRKPGWLDNTSSYHDIKERWEKK